MHYMVAAAGSDGIPLADYATFGSDELSAAALQAMSDTQACLLANHGQLATGRDLYGLDPGQVGGVPQHSFEFRCDRPVAYFSFQF